MPDIFLSYSRDDQAIARRFAEGFEREGFSVWWDQTLRSGEAYDKVTEKALEEARAVVVLWSKTSVDSRWVRSEATQADRYGTLVPVMIEPCKRPIMFELTHTADLIKWKGDADDPAWQSYVADVRGFVHKEASGGPAARPVVKRKRFRGLQIALSAATLLLAGAILLWAFNRAADAPASPVSLAVLPFENPDGSEPGRVLAFGVAESVLHQLANLSELSVISWSSAAEINNETQDVRKIAKELGVAYLLQGSVQRNGEVLRVTARLVDAASERNRWSLRWERKQQDVFSIQDEIAAQVTRALSVSVSPEGRERMRGQGTQNVEAYLAFLDGQDALSTWRTDDADAAATHFNRALQLDPKFARALVMLVRARMRRAEFSGGGPDLVAQILRARAELTPLIERAIAIDPQLGEAYVERGYLRGLDDPVAAEADYRKAIELTPSNSRAYQELVNVLWLDPARKVEVGKLLDRATELDPLDLELDVIRAVHLYYGLANAEEADRVLLNVLERNPEYTPALTRRGELLFTGLGRAGEGVKELQKALALDPGSDSARRFLVSAWATVGDLDKAQQVADEPESSPVVHLILAVAKRHLEEAAGLAYEAIEDGTLQGSDQWAAVAAINLDARRRGEYAKAGKALDELLQVQWVSETTAVLRPNPGLLGDVVVYADLMRAAGKEDRAQALLKVAEQAMDNDPAGPEVGEYWNTLGRARAAVLKGDKAAALTKLEQRCAVAYCWEPFELEPLFQPLHNDPRFKALLENLKRRRDADRRALQAN